MNANEINKNEALEMLSKILKPGDTVYTVLRSVSKSGMSRKIDMFMVDHEKNLSYLSGYAANACGHSRDARGAIKISGCGMDMGFDLVYSLGRVMFPDGFTIPQGKTGRNGDASGYDKDGGYAFNQRWL